MFKLITDEDENTEVIYKIEVQKSTINDNINIWIGGYLVGQFDSDTDQLRLRKKSFDAVNIDIVIDKT